MPDLADVPRARKGETVLVMADSTDIATKRMSFAPLLLPGQKLLNEDEWRAMQALSKFAAMTSVDTL